MSVSEATLVSDTFSEIFSELNANVQTITNSGGSTITLDQNNGNYWLGAYPDTDLITEKARYPIAILNTPEYDETLAGWRFNESVIEVEMSVYDTRAEHPPKFVEKAIDTVRNANIDDKLYNFQVVDTTKDVLTSRRGDLKVHVYTATIAFEYEVCV